MGHRTKHLNANQTEMTEHRVDNCLHSVVRRLMPDKSPEDEMLVVL